MRNADDIKRIFDEAVVETNPSKDEKILENITAAYKQTNKAQFEKIEPNVWRIIMKSRITKIAAAAVIVIAVLAGLPLLDSKQGVVLADVLAKIEQAQAFMYKMKMITTGDMMPSMPAGERLVESTVTISNSYGMKMEMTMTDANSGEKMTQQMYIIPEDEVAIMLMPSQKKYMRMEFDDDLLARMKKQNNGPREMIKQIMGCEHIELGCSVIDSIEVEGFQTTDPSFVGGAIENVDIRLWVDVENWLPVRAEMDFKMNEQMQMSCVIYDYQWDVQVDASEFEPVIPEDYTGFPTGGIMKLPSISEEAAIEGLKFLGEISGKYPKKLNFMDLMQEFEASPDREDKIENLTDAALKLQEEMEKMTEDEKIKKAMETMRLVQSISMFYMTLVQDKKDPAYYGESVGPDDADMVLLRWKVSDNQYRVIFGDLSAEDVTAEELTELETPLRE